ncbi:MAG: hypothetical protein RLY58_1167 [Pseudomonadota bacterium]|jgi:hypothetical protein
MWLEFELWEGQDYNLEDEFFNMSVELDSGEKYALNVWTYKYLERARNEYNEEKENLSGKYLLPPDLFIERLDRELLQAILSELVQKDVMKQEWLVIDTDEE